MATYRLSAKTIGRSTGRSGTAAAAYRAAERIHDRRTGLVHDYQARGGVVHAEIMAPPASPAWVADRSELWNRVEEVERRRDAQICREILVSLPHELDDPRRKELVRTFVHEAFVSRGMVADIAIHRAHEKSDQRNHHAHILLTLREPQGESFGPKVRAWNDKALLVEWRQAWEQHLNRELERAHVPERVSARSLADRGIDAEPEPRQGPVATDMERKGRRSHAGDDRRACKARNAERQRLREERRQTESRVRDEERHQGPSREEIDFRKPDPRPGIRSADMPDWWARRERFLAAAYETDVRSSKLARYWRIERVADGLRFENARGRFEDQGDIIVARDGNQLEIRGMLDVAELKGWRELVLTGSERFRQTAMAAAIERGFTIRAEGRDAEILRDIQQHVHDGPARERSSTPDRSERLTR